MSNKILWILLLVSSSYVWGQKYKNPYVLERSNKRVAITAIDVQENSIKIDFDYLGSHLYDDITISPFTKIVADNGKIARLIKTENISYFPIQTSVKTNQKHKFSLFFEKIELTKVFDILENASTFGALNFMRIELKDSDKLATICQPKEDSYLTYIPDELRFLFETNIFMRSRKDLRPFFDSFIEENILKTGIEEREINFGNRKTQTTAYTIFPKQETKNNALFYSFFFNKNENGNKINRIMVVFPNKDIARTFLNSIATQGRESFIKDDFHVELSLFNNITVYVLHPIYEGAYSVTIDSFTSEEYNDYIKGLK